MNVNIALVESWDRQCRILKAVAERINESNRYVKPSADGWSLDRQLTHIHRVRKFHLAELSAERSKELEDPLFDESYNPIQDLNTIKRMLDDSAQAVHDVLSEALSLGKEKVGAYDHPVFLLQHLVMHEGWHLGLIFLALRLNGEEVPEEYEETYVWGEWRSD